MRIIAALLLSTSLAFAQSTSTPPSFPNGSVFNGHIVSAGSAPPTVGGASCGAPVLSANATDLAGQFQAKGTSTCAVTFGTPFAAQPSCVVQDATTPADSGYTFTTSGTKITGILMGPTATNDLISWICVGLFGN